MENTWRSSTGVSPWDPGIVEPELAAARTEDLPLEITGTSDDRRSVETAAKPIPWVGRPRQCKLFRARVDRSAEKGCLRDADFRHHHRRFRAEGSPPIPLRRLAASASGAPLAQSTPDALADSKIQTNANTLSARWDGRAEIVAGPRFGRTLRSAARNT